MKHLPQIIIAVSAWFIGVTVARSQISTVSVWSLVLANLGVLGVARSRTRFAYVLLAASFCVFGLYRDLGWQLSVLALAGVLWLSPVFMSRRNDVQRSWRVILAATLGTYIARLR